MNEERRDQLLAAAEGADGFVVLRDLVRHLLDDGIRSDALLEDLSEIRALVPQREEDLILDVMDLLAGWCAPDFRLRGQ